MGLREKWIAKYVEKTPRSRELYEKATRLLPGGVNYYTRHFDPYPPFINKGRGCLVWDIDGNEYIDFWVGHYALIMGHGYLDVIEEASRQLMEGAHLGYEHEWEIKLAEQIRRMVPSVEMTRFTNSGTEANMYAARVARAYTGRKSIAKFEGVWHGGYDGLHKAVTYPYDRPPTAGLPEELVSLTLILPFNDLEATRRIIKREKPAAVFIDPVPSSGGFVVAEREFVRGLREVCDESGSLLVMDEVITGFRIGPGGAQELYGIDPDLTVFGKIVGGGMFPIGAFGGRSDIMEQIDHRRFRETHLRAFHGGTYSGNPLSTRAGYTILKRLEDGEVHRRLNRLGDRMRALLQDAFESGGIAAHVTGTSSLLGIHFSDHPPISPRDAHEHDDKNLALDFFYYMISKGVIYTTPLNTRIGLSASHDERHIDMIATLAEDFAKEIRSRRDEAGSKIKTKEENKKKG